MRERMDPRLRRRIAIVAGAAAWLLFVAAVALDPSRVDEVAVLVPLVWAIAYVASSTLPDPRRRKAVSAGGALGAIYGAIAAGLLLGSLVPVNKIPGGWTIALGVAAWASITVAAVMWPSKPVVQRPRRHISWIAFAALLPAVAAMFVVRMDDPGPLIAFVLLIVAALTMGWGILAGHDEPPEPTFAANPPASEP